MIMKTMINKILSVLAVFFFCLTTFTVSAVDLKTSLTIYYDITSYGNFTGKKLQIMIGKNNYSRAYEMKKVDGYDNIYSVNIGDANGEQWNGATQIAFFAEASIWGGENNSIKKRFEWTETETAIYDIKEGFSGDVLFTGKKTLVKSDLYYVAGNGTANNPWCNSNDWSPNLAANLIMEGKKTFESVPAGNYKFKVTKGSWDSPWGSGAIDYNNSTKNDCRFSNLGGDDEQNIVFTTTETADITISFNGSKVTIKAEFSTPAKEDSYVLMGVEDDWTTGISMQINEQHDGSVEYMLLGQEISKATDAIKIVKVDGCGNKLEYNSSVKTSSPVPYGYDNDGNIVLEDGIYDFYFDNQIYIGGELDKANVVYLDPKVEDGNDWEVNGARFAVYYFNDKTSGWVSADKCGGLYFAYIPAEYTRYDWVRIAENGSNRWEDRWDQTYSIDYDKNTPLTKLTKASTEEKHYDNYQTAYTGVCGNNYNDLDCTFPTFPDTVYVHINQFVENDLCNYVFDSFEQAFAVLKTRGEICDATTKYYGTLKEDEITFKVPVVMLVHYGPEYYRGTEKVGSSGGNVSEAPAIFFRNINKDGGHPLIVRTADPKGNRAVLVHPVIRRSKNIELNNLDILSDDTLLDNALDIDNGMGRYNREGLEEDFNKIPLPNTAKENATINVTIKN